MAQPAPNLPTEQPTPPPGMIVIPVWQAIDDVYTKSDIPQMPAHTTTLLVEYEARIRSAVDWPIANGKWASMRNCVQAVARGVASAVGPLYCDYKQFREAVHGFLASVSAWLFGDDARIRALETEVKVLLSNVSELQGTVSELQRTMTHLQRDQGRSIGFESYIRSTSRSREPSATRGEEESDRPDDLYLPVRERLGRAMRCAAASRSPSPLWRPPA